VSPDDFARLSVLIAADLADAIDPAHDEEQRIAAILRMLRCDPELALSMACSLLYGSLSEFEQAMPGSSGTMMLRLRANIARLPE
jgi:hypothetical protein